jgi:hypothetical protein
VDAKRQFRLTSIEPDHSVSNLLSQEHDMSTHASDRLRDALERLDQAIDRLEERLTARLDEAPVEAAKPQPNRAVVERLDRIIRQIELALE